MKKFFAIVAAFICISAAAQGQTIKANWNKGEVVRYQMTETGLKIQGNDTTDVKTSSATLVFKVLKVTGDSYKMSLTLKDVKNSDPLMDMLNTIRVSKFGDTKIVYTTDANGKLVSVDNLDKILSQGQKLLSPSMGLMQQQFGAEMTQEEYLSMYGKMKEMYSNPDFVMGTLAKYFRLFTFHGKQMEIGKKYDGKAEISSFVPGIDFPISVKTCEFMDQDTENEKMVVAYMGRQTEDASNVKKALVDAMKKTLNAIGPMTEDTEKSLEELLASMDESNLAYNEGRNVKVDVATGWPEAMAYGKLLDITLGGVRSCKVSQQDIVRIAE
jgi:hypothetical protein